jgi:DNA-binding transcriptional LysR family regulator
MVAVLPSDHPDAGLEAYPINKCKKENLIMPSEGDDADVRELFKRHGIVPNVRLTTLENYTAINMVEKGLGIGIMNEGITKHWKTGTVIIPVDPPSSIELGICLPSLEDAAPAVREFVLFAADKLNAKIPE